MRRARRGGWRRRRGGAAGARAGGAGAAAASGAGVAIAMALAVPAAGGVQRAFGTDAKALQVGFALDAGLRAADLAAAGATADPGAFDQWLAMLGADGPGPEAELELA